MARKQLHDADGVSNEKPKKGNDAASSAALKASDWCGGKYEEIDNRLYTVRCPACREELRRGFAKKDGRPTFLCSCCKDD